jgi:hypothetical protein
MEPLQTLAVRLAARTTGENIISKVGLNVDRHKYNFDMKIFAKSLCQQHDLFLYSDPRETYF